MVFPTSDKAKQELATLRAHQRIMVERGYIITCLNCENFIDKTKCALANVTPPPEVVLYGCEAWDQVIPF